MKNGYIEWISGNKIGFITNSFGRILYVNPNFPDGEYEKWEGPTKNLNKQLKDKCRQGRTFDKEGLMLELL